MIKRFEAYDDATRMSKAVPQRQYLLLRADLRGTVRARRPEQPNLPPRRRVVRRGLSRGFCHRVRRRAPVVEGHAAALGRTAREATRRLRSSSRTRPTSGSSRKPKSPETKKTKKGYFLVVKRYSEKKVDGASLKRILGGCPTLGWAASVVPPSGRRRQEKPVIFDRFFRETAKMTAFPVFFVSFHRPDPRQLPADRRQRRYLRSPWRPAKTSSPIG